MWRGVLKVAFLTGRPYPKLFTKPRTYGIRDRCVPQSPCTLLPSHEWPCGEARNRP